MEKIICIILLVLYGLVMLMMCCITLFKKNEKPKNNVHFYVARDKNGTLGLFLNKPRVHENVWMPCKHGFYLGMGCLFKKVGLNEADYKDLKFEDKPVEVFLNLED